MQNLRRSARLQELETIKRVEKQVVGPRTGPTKPKFHFRAASKWTKKEMNLLRCRFDKNNTDFQWNDLWIKAGAIPSELQQRKF